MTDAAARTVFTLSRGYEDGDSYWHSQLLSLHETLRGARDACLKHWRTTPLRAVDGHYSGQLEVQVAIVQDRTQYNERVLHGEPSISYDVGVDNDYLGSSKQFEYQILESVVLP